METIQRGRLFHGNVSALVDPVKCRNVSMKHTSSLDPFHKVTVTLWKRFNEDVCFMETFLRWSTLSDAEMFP